MYKFCFEGSTKTTNFILICWNESNLNLLKNKLQEHFPFYPYLFQQKLQKSLQYHRKYQNMLASIKEMTATQPQIIGQIQSTNQEHRVDILQADDQKQLESQQKDEMRPQRSCNSRKQLHIIKKQDQHELQKELKKMNSKKKIVVISPKEIVHEIKDQPQFKFPVSKPSPPASQRASSLKKIKKSDSLEKEVNKNKEEQSSANMMRIKFDEILCQDEPVSGQSENASKQIIQLNTYYRELQFEQDQKQQKQKKGTIMGYICGLIKLRLTRKNNQIQKKLIKLHEKHVTGEQQQVRMLKYIMKVLIDESPSVISQNWKKLGFITDEPLTQLKEAGVLFLLQWINFIAAHQQSSIKFTNLFIQLNCSVYHFHEQLSFQFYEQLKQGKIRVKTWQQCQELYNSIALACIEQVNKKSKIKIENIRQQTLNSIRKWIKESPKVMQTQVKHKKQVEQQSPK